MTTEQAIVDWISGYRRNWDQKCQALMWRLCEKFGSVPVDGIQSARDAYEIELAAGRINPGIGPGGTFQYYDIGEFFHDSYNMNGGRSLMATRRLRVELVESAAGWNTVEDYCATTGAVNLGWSYMNGGNTLAFDPDVNPEPAPGPDWSYYDPTGDVAVSIQQSLGNRGRYAGPADGIFGPETRKGIQRTIRNVGYTGPIDGIIGPVGCRLIQVYAQKFGGYAGPVDAILGPNSWAGFALGLATD